MSNKKLTGVSMPEASTREKLSTPVSQHGYEYVNDNVANHFSSSICSHPLVDPVLYGCREEHVFCRVCLEEANSLGLVECPLCREEVSKEHRRPLGGPLVRLLNALQVYCPHRRQGCKWTGSRSEVSAHVSMDCEHCPCVYAVNGSVVFV